MIEDDRGVGMVPTAAGFLVFMLFLLLAVQVLYGLYAARISHRKPDTRSAGSS